MFLRILRGQVYDGTATLAEVARLGRELGAGGLGWQRLTAGVGEGGELVLALRYDTEADARQAGFVRVVQGRLADPAVPVVS